MDVQVTSAVTGAVVTGVAGLAGYVAGRRAQRADVERWRRLWQQAENRRREGLSFEGRARRMAAHLDRERAGRWN